MAGLDDCGFDHDKLCSDNPNRGADDPIFCHVTTNRQPNERLVDFGTTLSIWFAKEARHQTAASEVRPWPWSELD